MIHHKIQQNTPEWEELRLGKITASNFGTIMANNGKAFGDPAKAYALQVALERICGRKSDNSFKTSHMERGHDMEPIARRRYEEKTCSKVEDGGFFEDGVFGCSPDGLIGTDGMLEIKSVVAKVHFATIPRGAPDPAYTWQLVGNLWKAERNWIDFVSYCADFPEASELVAFRVEKRDVKTEIDEMRDRLQLFAALVDEIGEKIRTLK